MFWGFTDNYAYNYVFHIILKAKVCVCIIMQLYRKTENVDRWIEF